MIYYYVFLYHFYACILESMKIHHYFSNLSLKFPGNEMITLLYT